MTESQVKEMQDRCDKLSQSGRRRLNPSAAAKLAEYLKPAPPTLPEKFKHEEAQFAYESAVEEINGSSKTMRVLIKVEPMGAPRMTRRDKWLSPRRDCVQRYFDYRDKLRLIVGDVPTVPDRIDCLFYISMPDTWSKKKKAQMLGKPHRQRPDRDNLDKAVMDALFLEDGGVWSGSQEKYWCKKGDERVEISMRFDKVKTDETEQA